MQSAILSMEGLRGVIIPTSKATANLLQGQQAVVGIMAGTILVRSWILTIPTSQQKIDASPAPEFDLALLSGDADAVVEVSWDTSES